MATSVWKGHLTFGLVSLPVRLFSAAEAILAESGTAWWPADRAEVNHNRAVILSGLDEAAFATSRFTGTLPMVSSAPESTSQASAARGSSFNRSDMTPA